MSDKPVLWTREEAIDLCVRLDAILEFHGFHCGIIGSVLTKGYSHNDLDLVIFPHNASEYRLEHAYEALFAFGLASFMSRAQVAQAWERQLSKDSKHVEVWRYNGKRIDLFFMR